MQQAASDFPELPKASEWVGAMSAKRLSYMSFPARGPACLIGAGWAVMAVGLVLPLSHAMLSMPWILLVAGIMLILCGGWRGGFVLSGGEVTEFHYLNALAQCAASTKECSEEECAQVECYLRWRAKCREHWFSERVAKQKSTRLRRVVGAILDHFYKENFSKRTVMAPGFVGDPFQVLIAHQPRLMPAADRQEVFAAYLHSAMKHERLNRIWDAEAKAKRQLQT